MVRNFTLRGHTMLTRKVFEQVAASVKKSVDKAGETKDLKLRDFAYDMAVELADYFEKENPRFDRDRFFNACGLVDRHFRVFPVEYVDAMDC